MRDLTPEASALLRSGRDVFRPDESDRDRVLHSLTQALGDGALVDGPRQAGPASDPPAARFRFRGTSVLGGVAALAVVAGAVVGAQRWARTAPPARVVSPVAAPAEPDPSSPASLPNGTDRSAEPAQVERPSAPPRPGVRAGGRATSDSLAEEVRLLSTAERQLNDGRGEDALATLAEHERRFPKGALTEERMAAHAEALCALGRVAEAKMDLARFARRFPRSAHIDRARRVCGSALDL